MVRPLILARRVVRGSKVSHLPPAFPRHLVAVRTLLVALCRPAAAGESLAGVHEKYAAVVLDEAAQMPESLLATAEAALSTGPETRLIVTGNPTSTGGALHRAAVIDRDKGWHVTNVSGDPEDPERSPRIDVEWAASMILRYGRESPFVQVAVLGQFPTSALHTLLSRDEVLAAMGREVAD